MDRRRIKCLSGCLCKRHQDHKGENNPRWKGGRYTSHQGYIYIYKPDHIFSKNNYVSEQNLVMEDKLGHLILPCQVVHHINEIKNDNRPENLEVMCKLKHISFHNKGKQYHLGYTHDKESRRRISEAKKGNQYRKGMKASDETKRRMSIERKGLKYKKKVEIQSYG